LWFGDKNAPVFIRNDAHAADDYWGLWRQLISGFILRDGDGKQNYKLQLTDTLSADTTADGGQGGNQGARGGYPDDRAFTYTLACVAGQAGFGRLDDHSTHTDIKDDGEQAWYRLLDVDSGKSLDWGISNYELRWLKDRTYMRWLEDGSLYGYTDFSAAMLVKLTTNDKGEQVVGFVPTYYHYHLMYLDQLLLLLYERVTLYLFSAAISDASHDYFTATQNTTAQDLSVVAVSTSTPGADSTLEKEALDRFHALREQFTLLTNLYQFPMFTAQYQGQEMYTLARESLRVEQLYKEVETEIRATDEWLAARVTERRADAADLLNQRLGRIQVVGAIIGALSVGLSMLGVGLTLFQLRQSASSSLSIVLFQFGAGTSAGPPNTLIGIGEYVFVCFGILLVAFAIVALVVYAVVLLVRALW